MVPQQIIEEFKNLDETSDFLSSKFSELQRKYGGKFIVIKDKEIIFVTDSFKEIINKIDAGELKIDEIIIKFIPAKGEIILY